MTTREPGASEVFTARFTVRPRSTAFFASSPAASMTEGLLVLVQLVIAAMSTLPCLMSTSVAGRMPFSVTMACAPSAPFLPKPFSVTGLSSAARNFAFNSGSAMRSCGRFGPATLGCDVGQVQFEIGAVDDAVGLGRNAEKFLRLEIALERLDLLLRAAGRPEVIDRFGIDREVAHRRAILGGHVRDGRAVGQRQRRRAGAVELDELADDLLLAEHLGDVEREVGRGDAFAQRAGHVDADDFRREEIDRLAEHARLGLDAAHAPADDAEAVDHGGVGIGADERVGIINRLAVDLGGEDALGEVFEIDLVDDADAGRHDLEGLERLLAPLEKFVALAVAVELEFEIADHRVGRCRRHRPAPSGRRRDRPARAARSASDFSSASATAWRMAARSTRSGTPVKSCRTMRATTKGISSETGAFAFQLASVRMSFSLTRFPSKLRSTASRTMRMLTGNLEIGPTPASSSAGSE